LLRSVAEKAVLLYGPARARRDDTPQTRYSKQQLGVDPATRMMSEKLGFPIDPSKTAVFAVHYVEIISKNPDEIRHAALDANESGRAYDRITIGGTVVVTALLAGGKP
jgi:hypothetical protein